MKKMTNLESEIDQTVSPKKLFYYMTLLNWIYDKSWERESIVMAILIVAVSLMLKVEKLPCVCHTFVFPWYASTINLLYRLYTYVQVDVCDTLYVWFMTGGRVAI